MTGPWVTIRYRDFYDIPRAVVVEWHGQTYLFDCLYDHEVDDYNDDYTVYRLPEAVAQQVETISWTDLGRLGERVGAIPTARVSFDPTKRRALNSEVFDEFGLG